MLTKTSLALTAISVIAISAPASAATFGYTNTDFSTNASQAAGIHKSITTTFNDITDEFTWSSTISRNTRNGHLADGAWLVVSDGPNPKGIDNELAIFYLDGINNKVSIYNYNGVNGNNSWKRTNPQLLGSIALNVNNSVADERTFSFNVDMTDINNLGLSADWKGTSFSEKIGIWFHATSYSDMTYHNSSGRLKGYSFAKQSYYDTAFQTTTDIPEPSSLAALGLFAAAAAASKLSKRIA
ncbi:MAG: hypothetical protein HC800_09995 [Phormidesmis sp. RL_2_1]|nr:hypothetical protein [Phormidesmis sp. RL_2_1]